jgi:hypothetical protein
MHRTSKHKFTAHSGEHKTGSFLRRRETRHRPSHNGAFGAISNPSVAMRDILQRRTTDGLKLVNPIISGTIVVPSVQYRDVSEDTSDGSSERWARPIIILIKHNFCMLFDIAVTHQSDTSGPQSSIQA